jgi:hypothetical protein
VFACSAASFCGSHWRPGGLALVRKNYATYEQMMVESLTLQPFNGSLQPAADALDVGFVGVPGSVTAITLDPAPA